MHHVHAKACAPYMCMCERGSARERCMRAHLPGLRERERARARGEKR